MDSTDVNIRSSMKPGDATAAGDLPAEAYVVALVSLREMGPARLAALLDSGGPQQIWQRVLSGRAHEPRSQRILEAMGPKASQVARQWARDASSLDVSRLWKRHVDAGVGVAIRTAAAYPSAFLNESAPPPIVFFRGDPDVIVGTRVAIVGTRNCTRYGYDIASQLGHDLASCGVGTVSGLALGIDGAAHAGALDAREAAGDAWAPPIAVVGSGLDVIYPRRNASLWHRVADAGVIISEYPLGTPAEAWHFPTRNRLIVALADIVVVVESQNAGGSMITVDEALERGISVMAVPGPVTSKTSAGTNKVIADGGGIVRDVDDVLTKLGLDIVSPRKAVETRNPVRSEDDRVLRAIEWQPATVDQLALRTGLDLLDLSVALDRLERDRWVARSGGWYERVAKPGG